MRKFSIFTCLLATLFSFGCKKNETPEEQSKLVITNPIQRDTVIFKNYVCQVNSIQHIELRALEKGYLQNIYVDEGQYLKKGQLMFKVMPSIYEAEVLVAKAEKEFEEIEYLTTKKLADKNIVSANELALSKAKFEKAKAELQLANVHLNFTEIRAPFDGYMGKFNVRLGSLLDEGELLTTLSDNRKVWVYFNVPEAEYLNYKIHNKIMPKVRLLMANNELFDGEGTIETIEADFDNETGNIAFRATFDNSKDLLRHGQTGNILMPVVLKNVVIIPQEATFEVMDKKFVYVMDKNNVVHTREIQIAAELPQLYVVSKGLSTNDKVLLEGLKKVRNNQKIAYTFKSTNDAIKEMNGLFSE